MRYDMNLPLHLLPALRLIPSAWLEYMIDRMARNHIVRLYLLRRDMQRVRIAKEVQSVICIADVNLGDAVNFQPVADILRAHLPECTIDYVCNRTAAPLVANNPAIRHCIPVFDGQFTPLSEETEVISRLLADGNYDLALSFCPFLSDRAFAKSECPVIGPVRFARSILAEVLGDSGGSASLGENLGKYVDELGGTLSQYSSSLDCSEEPFHPELYLTETAVAGRDRWMHERGIDIDKRTVIFNPDASNRYNLVDEPLQSDILRRILRSSLCEQLLMAHCFACEGVDQRVLSSLPVSLRQKVTLIPSDLPIDAYVALLDVARVYVSGDTGPVHLAAARKISTHDGIRFRNRTGLCTIFGPTLPEIYGYDSHRAAYADSAQDAPARVFQGRCPHKTICCSLARISEQCERRECFYGISGDTIADYVLGLLAQGTT